MKKCVWVGVGRLGFFTDCLCPVRGHRGLTCDYLAKGNFEDCNLHAFTDEEKKAVIATRRLMGEELLRNPPFYNRTK